MGATVITGDLTQTDLPARTESGLSRVIKVLKNVDGIATLALTESDVVRHPLVKKIIRAYDQWDEKA